MTTATITTNTISLNVLGTTFKFNQHKFTPDYRNYNTEDYAKFAELRTELKSLGGGTTGGHHGTDYAYEAYEVKPGTVVLFVLPGALTKGFLEFPENF